MHVIHTRTHTRTYYYNQEIGICNDYNHWGRTREHETESGVDVLEKRIRLVLLHHRKGGHSEEQAAGEYFQRVRPLLYRARRPVHIQRQLQSDRTVRHVSIDMIITLRFETDDDVLYTAGAHGWSSC